MASTWKSNEHAKDNSGERTRLACWRACPRDRELFCRMLNAQDVATHKGRLFRRDAETSTRAACAPRIPPSQPKWMFGL